MKPACAHTRFTTSLAHLCALLTLVVACAPTSSATPAASSLSTGQPSATPQASAPASEPAPSPSAQASLAPTAWERAFELEHGALGALVPWQGGLIGSGCIHDASGNCNREIVVSSTDGRSWDVVELDGATDFGFGSLRRAGERLFALGYGHFGGSGGAVIWTSPDGREWSRVRSTTFQGRAVNDVISSPVGTIAVGYNAPVDSDNSTGFVTWPIDGDGSFGGMRVVDTSASFTLVLGVVWTGEEFLAWGGRSGPYPSRTTSLLSSPDGKTWVFRGEIRTQKRNSVAQIIAVGNRLIAVGAEGLHFPLTPAGWTSDDGGRTWKAADVEGDTAGMSAVVVEDRQLIARGIETFGHDGDQLPVSWISTRGTSWTLLPSDQDLPAVRGFTGITPMTIGDRTCVAGTIDGTDARSAAIYCREAG
jgi:hypothetical protein